MGLANYPQEVFCTFDAGSRLTRHALADFEPVGEADNAYFLGQNINIPFVMPVFLQ